jgi:hypothetical protein
MRELAWTRRLVRKIETAEFYTEALRERNKSVPGATESEKTLHRLFGKPGSKPAGNPPEKLCPV